MRSKVPYNIEMIVSLFSEVLISSLGVLNSWKGAKIATDICFICLKDFQINSCASFRCNFVNFSYVVTFFKEMFSPSNLPQQAIILQTFFNCMVVIFTIQMLNEACRLQNGPQWFFFFFQFLWALQGYLEVILLGYPLQWI